ncbi:MAG: hypothetical protein ACI86H_001108 [bacterium]|jgi:hypothetical protein
MKRNIQRVLFSFFLFLWATLPLSALEVTGEGVGNSGREAKQEAMSDLSTSIRAEVNSKYEQISASQGGKYSTDAKKSITVSSHLPLIGIATDVYPKGKGYKAIATLDSRKVIRLYESKLKDLAKEIKVGWRQSKSSQGETEYQALQQLLKTLDQFARHKAVAVLLNSKKIPKIAVTETEVKNRLTSLQQNAVSLALAAKSLGKNLKKYRGIYIYPATTRQSQEITQFASVMRDRLSNQLRTVRNLKQARYIMHGNYEITKTGIEITYHLLNMASKTLASQTVKLSPVAYQNYSYKPKRLSFSQMLYKHKELVKSTDFKVGVMTNQGNQSLLFKANEEIELFVKLNRSGYFYIVGHVFNSRKKMSYVLELTEAVGNRKFIVFVSPDDVNKWVSIGKFTVEAPFGTESLQVIASNKDLMNSIPKYDYDESSEYYIVSRDPEKAIVKTRALKRKKRTKKKRMVESVLMMTTIVR